MTAPTRTRRFPETVPSADKPRVLRSAASKAASAPSEGHSYVIRSVVDRRSHDRRASPRRDGEARSITQPNPEKLLELDSTLRAYFDNAIGSASDEAYGKGRAEGRREALVGSTAVAAAIGAAAGDVSHFSSKERAFATDAVLELAERIATEVMNRMPHDSGAAVLQRIRDVMEDINDEQFSIAVHADDLDIISAGLDGAKATVTVDPHLQQGEARIRGAWSYIDLTTAAAWEEIRTALSADHDPNQLPPEAHQPK